MVVVAPGVYLWIRAHRQALEAGGAPAPAIPAKPSTARGGTLGHVLLVLAVATLVARLVGAGFQRFLKQPPVMGEIVAGLLLGPSVLGALWPAGHAFLLPPEV